MLSFARSRDNGCGSTAEVEQEALDLDDVFNVLSNSRRRAILHILNERDVVSKRELVDYLAEHEYDKPISAITSTERKRVYVSVVQAHAPKLEDYGVIERNRDMIRLGPNAEQCLSYITDDTLAEKIRSLL